MKLVLSAIYVCNGVKYYEIVAYDNTFVKIQSYVLTIQQLIKFVEGVNPAFCDFRIVQGILECNPTVTEIPITQDLLHDVLATNGEELQINQYSLYRLLEFGVQNDLLVLNSVDDDELQAGYGVARFKDIKFSESTMTVYIQMHNADGIFNKMITTANEGTLTFRKFFVAAKNSTAVPGCVDLKKSIILHNVEYHLFETDELCIYDESVRFIPGVLNQACFESVVFKTLSSMCKDFIQGITSCISTTDASSAWVGGSKDYKSSKGVWLKSSLKPLTTRERKLIEDVALRSETDDCAALQSEVYERVKYSLPQNRLVSVSVKIFAELLTEQGDLTDKVDYALLRKTSFDKRVFWADMYAYRVRTITFLHKRKLTQVGAASISGGCNQEFTVVNTNF